MARARRLVPETRLHGFATVAFAGLLPVLEEHPALELTVVGEPADYSEAVDAPLIQVSTSDPADGAPTDWFDLGISVTVAGEDVPLAPLIEAIARGHEHLILDSGTWFSLDRPELEALRALVEEARSLQDKPTDPLRISVVHAGLWEELAALGVVEQQSARWSQAVGALLDLDAVEPAELPEGLEATLRPYQVDGFRWLSLLWDCGLGGVLADDMGLGKTLQMLAMVAAGARARRARRPGARRGADVRALDVGRARRPGSRRGCAPWSSTARGRRPRGRAGRYRRRGAGRHHVVCRGAHRRGRLPVAGVGSGGARRGAVRQEPPGQDLPGGAAAHGPGEVRDHRHSARELAHGPVVAAVDRGAGAAPATGAVQGEWAKPIESGGDAERLAALRRRIRPLMLRRTKEAVATELPPKQEQVLSVDLHPRHRAVYDRHLQRERQRLLGLIDDVRATGSPSCGR